MDDNLLAALLLPSSFTRDPTFAGKFVVANLSEEIPWEDFQNSTLTATDLLIPYAKYCECPNVLTGPEGQMVFFDHEHLCARSLNEVCCCGCCCC